MFPRAARISVVGPARRVDVVVPTTVPAAELLPELLRLTAPDGAEAPESWALSSLDGRVIAAEQTLEEGAVGDGALLVLKHRNGPTLGVLGWEPVDVMADVVDTRLPRWGWRHGARAAAAAAGIALLVGALELVSRTIGGGRPAPAVAALALGAAGVAIAALLRADHAAGTALGALSAPALGLGLAALGARGGSSAWFLCLLCAGTAAGAAVTHASDRSRHAALGLAAAAGALGLAALAAVAWTAADVEAVAMVLVVAGVAALPRLSLRIAGLPTDPRGVRAQAVVSLTPRAHDLTTWLLAGTGLAAAALSVPLALQAGIYGRLLVAFAGLALLLRARSFTVLGEVLAPAVAGAACLVILVTGLAASIGASLQAALVVGLPAIVAALAAAAGPRPGSPALQLGARRAELVANLALLPLIAGQLGLYTLVHDLTAGIL